VSPSERRADVGAPRGSESGFVRLPRGGYLVSTPDGYVQFGTPPETIKDTMGLPGSVPRVFVLPRRMFNWRKGINLSDLEFPIYHNFFLKKQKTHIVGSSLQIARLASALSEAIFGPRDRDLRLAEDFGGAAEAAPDMRREMDYFRHGLRFRDLVTVGVLRDGVYDAGPLRIGVRSDDSFEVRYAGRRLAVVPGTVEYEATFQRGERLPEPFEPPLFGVTCLGSSHGFDPRENTSGFVVWLNHSGIMVDPPVNATEWLEASNVNPKLIDSVILTHCHADHDAGTMQKILEEGKVSVYSTPTVMGSFLRKYGSLTGEAPRYLEKLFTFHPVTCLRPTYVHGGEFVFRYSLHSIPTLAFTLSFQDQSLVYSSDHQADPQVQRALRRAGVIGACRARELRSFPWDRRVIYHEAGIPPLHTPVSYLGSLDLEVQRRTVVYHMASKDFPEGTELRRARFGIENTLYLAATPPAYESTYGVLNVLKHLDFLETMTVEKVQEFVASVAFESFRKGEVIIRKGTPGDKFYVISSGNVAILDEVLETKKVLGTYEYFGEMALLTGALRGMDVVALTGVKAYSLPKERFLGFIRGTQYARVLERLVRNRSNETWSLLTNNPKLGTLTNYQRTWLESILVPRELKGKGTLLRQGAPVEAVYIVCRGSATVRRAGQKPVTLGRGEFIGDIAALQRRDPSPVTVTHARPLKVFVIEGPDAVEFIDRNPGLGMKLASDD
jgi:CRP-like cAMP-binding protein